MRNSVRLHNKKFSELNMGLSQYTVDEEDLDFLYSLARDKRIMYSSPWIVDRCALASSNLETSE